MKKLFQLIKEYYILYTKFGPIQRKWLLFLKHHPEKQKRNVLGTKYSDDPNDYKACCLGQFGLMNKFCIFSKDNVLLDNVSSSDTMPSNANMLKYGFYASNGEHATGNRHSMSLAGINDTKTWLDVYYACINDPKGYFNKKV